MNNNASKTKPAKEHVSGRCCKLLYFHVNRYLWQSGMLSSNVRGWHVILKRAGTFLGPGSRKRSAPMPHCNKYPQHQNSTRTSRGKPPPGKPSISVEIPRGNPTDEHGPPGQPSIFQHYELVQRVADSKRSFKIEEAIDSPSSNIN